MNKQKVNSKLEKECTYFIYINYLAEINKATRKITSNNTN